MPYRAYDGAVTAFQAEFWALVNDRVSYYERYDYTPVCSYRYGLSIWLWLSRIVQVTFWVAVLS